MVPPNSVNETLASEKLDLIFDTFTEPFSHLDRIAILQRDQADHVIAVHFRKGIFKGAARAFGRITFAPAFPAEHPTQFKSGPTHGIHEPDPADAFAGLFLFHGPNAIP